tara:strand:- start:404 stop:934 length:531 start_codon:yes stop_codon:yes gene_type:complete
MGKNKDDVVIHRHFGQKNIIDKDHSILSFKKKNRLRYLINAVSEIAGIDISSDTRKREVVYLRAVYFKLAVELTRYSYEAISKLVNRDHATVTHAMTHVWEEIETYRPDVFEIYEQLINDLDDQAFSELKVVRIKKEMESLQETLINIKKEINKDYFSLQQKLVNIKKVAYNEIVE